MLREEFPETKFYVAGTGIHTWVRDGNGLNYDLYWPAIGVPLSDAFQQNFSLKIFQNVNPLTMDLCTKFYPLGSTDEECDQ